MHRRRVAITGIGMLTPAGFSTTETWTTLLQGRSGIGPITVFDASAFPTRIAGSGSEPIACRVLQCFLAVGIYPENTGIKLTIHHVGLFRFHNHMNMSERWMCAGIVLDLYPNDETLPTEFRR